MPKVIGARGVKLVHEELKTCMELLVTWKIDGGGVCVCVFFFFFNNFIDVKHVPLQVILHAPVVLLIHELHNICLDWIQSFDLVLCVFLVILVVL